jgi:hypothetical protein
MIKRPSRFELVLARRIIKIERRFIHMANQIQTLLAAMQRAEGVEDTAVQLVRGTITILQELRVEVASQGFDPKSIDQAIADLNTHTDALVAAITDGTAADADPSPAPVVSTPVASVPAPGDVVTAPPVTTGTTTPSAPTPPVMTFDPSAPTTSAPTSQPPADAAPAPSNTPLPVNPPSDTVSADPNVPPTKVDAADIPKADEPGPAAPAQADGSSTPLTGDPEAPGSTVNHS